MKTNICYRSSTSVKLTQTNIASDIITLFASRCENLSATQEPGIFSFLKYLLYIKHNKLSANYRKKITVANVKPAFTMLLFVSK